MDLLIEDTIPDVVYHPNGTETRRITRERAKNMLRIYGQDATQLPATARDLAAADKCRIGLGFPNADIVAVEWMPGYVEFGLAENYLD